TRFSEEVGVAPERRSQHVPLHACNGQLGAYLRQLGSQFVNDSTVSRLNQGQSGFRILGPFELSFDGFTSRFNFAAETGSQQFRLLHVTAKLSLGGMASRLGQCQSGFRFFGPFDLSFDGFTSRFNFPAETGSQQFRLLHVIAKLRVSGSGTFCSRQDFTDLACFDEQRIGNSWKF
ncbi:hypothetical protein, partial [Mesorhizobium sp. P5_C1]